MVANENFDTVAPPPGVGLRLLPPGSQLCQVLRGCAGARYGRPRSLTRRTRRDRRAPGWETHATMDRKRRLVTRLQVKLLNPPIRALAARGLAPGVALLETTGRTSGEPRVTPVSYGLERGTDTFWIVAEMGRKAAYV